MFDYENAISGIAGAVNRFDDHMAVHSSQTPDIHWVVCLSKVMEKLIPEHLLTDFTLGAFHTLASLLRSYLRKGAQK